MAIKLLHGRDNAATRCFDRDGLCRVLDREFKTELCAHLHHRDTGDYIAVLLRCHIQLLVCP